MATPGGQWVQTLAAGGLSRRDWVPDEQPKSPDGSPGRWHVVRDGPETSTRWEWFPAPAPVMPTDAAAMWKPWPEFIRSAVIAAIFIIVGAATSISAAGQRRSEAADYALGDRSDPPSGSLDIQSSIGGLAVFFGVAVVLFAGWRVAYRLNRG